MPSASADAPKKIQLNHIAHVYYTHANFGRAHAFLLDFGFVEEKRIGKKTYYRGFGSEPWLYCATDGDEDAFGGAAFAVDSLEDLELATKTLPGASSIYELEDAPGKGKCVTFKDPVDGFPYHLVYGQESREASHPFPQLNFNFPEVKHRPVGQFQRFKKGPCPIHKLGHFGMCVTNFAKAYEFYTKHFNFKASDIVYEDGKDVSAFMHLDRGSEMVDHHCFFFFEGPKWHVHHSSYEVHDFDSQVLGHDWLREKQYRNCWGVGRHVMGSQIFDYWFDTSEFILEHYVDGDTVNESTPTSRTKAGPDNLHVWGPDLPTEFLQ